MSQKSWLAAYLFYTEPWEAILTDALQPFVARTLQRGLADQYFFIRYWERGPHLRLRFYGDTQILETKLKPELTAHFNDYMASHPTKREAWAEEAAVKGDWYPNNSVQYITYEAEVARYGGEAGMPIGEKQFQASSNAVLAAIEESETWDYERALGAAIQLHLTFAHALDMTLEELTTFFELVGESWLPRAYSYEEKTTAEEHAAKRAETLKAFESTFSEQREMLGSFVQTLWQALNDNVVFEQEWLNTWHTDMAAVGEELQRVFKAGDLRLDMYKNAVRKHWEKAEPKLPWPILESYVHMTNNRLGILNMDEAFLGYLIKETVAAL